MVSDLDAWRREIIELALEEEVLLLLDKYHRYRDDYQVPFALSQRGIAMATGVVINNLPRTLNKMIEKGLIKKEVKRVKGVRRKLNTYFLTDIAGRKEVKKLNDFIHGIRVVFIENDGGMVEITLGNLVKRLNAEFQTYDLYNFLIDNFLYDNFLRGHHGSTAKGKSSGIVNVEGANGSKNIFRCIIAPKFKRRNGVKNNNQDWQDIMDGKLPETQDNNNGNGAGKNIILSNNEIQIIYYAREIKGDSRKPSARLAVKLTITAGEDFEVLKVYGIEAMRAYKIQRLTNEAFKQGGLLSETDLVGLLSCSYENVRENILKLRSDDIFIPIAGSEPDTKSTLGSSRATGVS